MGQKLLDRFTIAIALAAIAYFSYLLIIQPDPFESLIDSDGGATLRSPAVAQPEE